MRQRSNARAPVAMSTAMMRPVLYAWSNGKTAQRCCVHLRTAFVEWQLHSDDRPPDRVSQVLHPPRSPVDTDTAAISNSGRFRLSWKQCPIH